MYGDYQRKKARKRWFRINKWMVIMVILDVILFAWFVSIQIARAEERSHQDTYLSNPIQFYCEIVGEKYHVLPELLEAIIETESSGNPSAKNGNCIGLMQVNGIIHADRMAALNVNNLMDSFQNILVGTDYLVELCETYGDVVIALAKYHGESDALSDGYVESAYVRKIMQRSYELEVLHGKVSE